MPELYNFFATEEMKSFGNKKLQHFICTMNNLNLSHKSQLAAGPANRPSQNLGDPPHMLPGPEIISNGQLLFFFCENCASSRWKQEEQRFPELGIKQTK